MSNISGSPAEPAAKMNRQQRRQANRQAKKTRKSRTAVVSTEVEAKAIKRELDAAYRAHLAEDFKLAVEHYERVLTKHPNHHDALLQSGLLANQVGDFQAAVRRLPKALGIKPDNPVALHHLGAALTKLGRLDEAMVAIQRALRIDPGSAAAHVTLGTALQAKGQFDEADKAFEQALTIDPNSSLPYEKMAQGRKVTRGDDLIARIQEVLARAALSQTDKSRLHFALGKCFNDTEAYDAAFQHYDAANELSGKSQKFDLSVLIDRFDRLISTFTPQFFEARTSLGSDSERPVFVVGMPRSGTTLVEQIVGSHPKAFGIGELMTITRIVEKLPSVLKTSVIYPEYMTLIDEKAAGSLANLYLRALSQAPAEAVRVIDKMPNNFRHLGMIALLFPKARIIHCRRNPMDLCLSCYFQNFSGRLGFAFDLTYLGQYYRQYERLMAHWKSVLSVPILDVFYEDLVADPEKISRRMIDHCNLEWDSTCLEFHRSNRPVITASIWQVRRPVYKTSVERWRRYERHLEPLKRALAGTEDVGSFVARASTEKVTDTPTDTPVLVGTRAKPRRAEAVNRQQRRQAARKVKNQPRAAVPAANQDHGIGDDLAHDLEVATRLHRAGDLNRAAETYRRILQRHPEQAKPWHLLGLTAYQSGQHETAVELIRRALTFNPNDAEAHHHLGMALHKQAKHREAIPCFLRAIKIDPRHHIAFGDLGIVLVAVGRIEEGTTAYRQSITLDPTNVAVHSNLGIALVALGRLEDGIASYQQALALDSSHVATHSNLGAALVAAGRIEEGIAAYQRAITLDPDCAIAYCNLGNALKHKGLFEHAAQQFDKALAIDPTCGPAYKNLVATKKIQCDDPLISRIERLMHEPDLPPGDRSIYHFALAKCFDDIAKYDKSFQHYQAGNQLKRKLIGPFDAVSFIHGIDQIIAVFNREFLESRPFVSNQSERPVFIIGMPRSGTTLVEQILAAHPEVSGAGELRSINRALRDLHTSLGTPKQYPECVALIDDVAARNLANGYLEDLEKTSVDAPRITDKMPSNFLHLGIIAMLFPRARIIHCRRNPMDVCLSCYFQDFADPMPFTYDLTDLGRYYQHYERLMTHWNNVLPVPILDVQYENLVDNEEQVSREMISFCGLDWNGACLTFHETDRPVRTASDWQVRQPIYKTSVERWRHYEKHLGPLKTALGDAC